MGKESEKVSIEYFNPDVEVLDISHQDLLFNFNAGDGNENFTEFLLNEAIEYANNGNGVTYVVYNICYDENAKEAQRDVVGYYTLAATAIPYTDRIRLEEDEAREQRREFDEETCGISAIEIKMFAVDKKYQDLFFKYEDLELPIAAWVMRSIVDYAYTLLNEVLGVKALFLHAVPESEEFYLANGFNWMKINMQPLQCVDSEYKAMYLVLKEVHMNYDE